LGSILNQQGAGNDGYGRGVNFDDGESDDGCEHDGYDESFDDDASSYADSTFGYPHVIFGPV
jgi:hypothetical protein